ncbi:MAG: hypothetical protein K1X95_12505 [Acidimicrobiia bacterium]|nr:hypothetical protein [Acidimicrobiia bacterium]
MFVQVIEGKCSDADALHERLDIWQRDLMAGAIGYLGSTAGVTDSGDCIIMVRFESEDAARRNSERPEQDAWWQETAKCFTGPATFHDTSDVQVMRECDSDEAHFVQVMEGHVDDVGKAHELEDRTAPLLAEQRPDLMGAYTAYHGDGYTTVAYFTDEASAREGEKRQPPEDLTAEMNAVMPVERYLDLRDPWVASAHV